MLRYYFLVFLLIYNVLCVSEECVTYNFEDNQKVNFTNTYGICLGMSSWDVGQYSSLSIDSPHRDSTAFIKPRTSLSCISSFKFSVTALGIFELNVYMEPTSIRDQITLLVFKSLPGANDATVANALLSPSIPNFVAGWQTVRVKIMGSGTHEGYAPSIDCVIETWLPNPDAADYYTKLWRLGKFLLLMIRITLLGMASTSSTVLVDSFRYIAPTYDKDSCVIYQNEKPTTKIPTEITTTPDTIKTSTTTEKSTTITITTGPVTSTTENTIITDRPSRPSRPSTISIPTTTETPTTIPITEKTSTIAIPSSPVTSTTEKPSSNVYETTTRVTTPISTTQTTSTERPRRSVSILLIKIKKFFR